MAKAKYHSREEVNQNKLGKACADFRKALTDLGYDTSNLIVHDIGFTIQIIKDKKYGK